MIIGRFQLAEIAAGKTKSVKVFRMVDWPGLISACMVYN